MTLTDFIDMHYKPPAFVMVSPTVVPPPPEESGPVVVGGYCFLDQAFPIQQTNLPGELEKFLSVAPSKAPVYIGFGSMPAPKNAKFGPLLRSVLVGCPDNRFII